MLSIGSNINEVRVDGNPDALRRDLTSFLGFGLTAAEISIHGLDLIKNGRLDRRRAETIAAILDDFPFVYSAHAPNPLNLMDRVFPDLHRAVLNASLEFCTLAKIDMLVYHPGRYLAEEEFAVSSPVSLPEDEQLYLLEVERTILRETADACTNVVIAMENARPYLHHSPYCYAEQPQQLLEQVQSVARRNVRVNLDFGHLFMAARHYGFEAADAVRLLAPCIAHCHVHDNFGAGVNYSEKMQTHLLAFGKGDLHLPVGWGAIPFPELFREFIADFDGMLICELRGRYFNYTGEAARNLAGILGEIGVDSQIGELSVV
ncbi:MAG TPA: sugar phosphate isomerase/epimerase [Desulfuromonadales bacterium]|nr:sugar phosphate isomerase/epimerase [Desulfuromonadales bacterium]